MREVVYLSCCVDIDRRSKFCFLEYETDTAAEKAVDKENGRNFKGSNLSINSSVCISLSPNHVIHCK